MSVDKQCYRSRGFSKLVMTIETISLIYYADRILADNLMIKS